MATELAKAYVQIVPSAMGIKGKLTEELGGEAESAGTNTGNKFASVLKTVIVSAGIGTAVKEALSAGADLQQSLGGVETLFKDSADTVIANAKNAYKTAGMSANEYMETVTGFSASLLQGLSGDTAKAATVADMALTDMSDNANKMGTSMELIQNAYQGFAKQNYTMLDNLKLGYGGTKTEMQRLLKDAQELTGVKYDIDNLSDVYSAIHVIQDEMGITGTTAEEAATTFSGSLSSMKAAFQDLLGNLTLGNDITDSLSAVSDTVYTFVVGNLIPMLGNIIQALPQVLGSAISMIVRSFNIAANNADEIVQNGTELVSQLAVGIISGLPYLAESALQLIASFGNAILNTDWAGIASNFISGLKENMNMAAGEIFGADEGIITEIKSAITTNLPGLLENGVEIITNIANGMMESLPTIITAIGDIFTELLNYVISILPEFLNNGVQLISNLATGIANNLPAILQAISTVVDGLLTTIEQNLPQLWEKGIQAISNLASGIASNLPAIISAIASTIAGLLARIGESLPELLQKGIELIGELAAGIIQAIPDVVAAIPDVISGIADTFGEHDWGSIGLNIIEGVANGISGAVGTIIEAAENAAKGAFEAAKDFLGIKSPSRLFMWLGEQTDAGLAKGLTNNTELITDAVSDITKMMTDAYSPKISVKSLLDYNVSRSAESNDTADSSISEKLDRLIYLLEILTGQEIKMLMNNREIGRILREMGVSFA